MTLSKRYDPGLTWINDRYGRTGILTSMFSSIRSTGGQEAKRLRGLRGSAHAGLIAAWVVFWLNTALFPCCEVTAAVLGGQADSAMQSPSSTPSPHHSDAPHTEPLDHGPDAPCGDTLSANPPLVGENEVRTPERSSLEWFAIDAPVATSFTSVQRAANFALARASPPPPLRPHLRTQRLLI